MQISNNTYSSVLPVNKTAIEPKQRDLQEIAERYKHYEVKPLSVKVLNRILDDVLAVPVEKNSISQIDIII